MPLSGPARSLPSGWEGWVIPRARFQQWLDVCTVELDPSALPATATSVPSLRTRSAGLCDGIRAQVASWVTTEPAGETRPAAVQDLQDKARGERLPCGGRGRPESWSVRCPGRWPSAGK